MVWTALAAPPFSVAGFWLATTHAGDLAPILGPMGAAAPFAAVTLYWIRTLLAENKQAREELTRVNNDVLDKFVQAINDATSLHRESTRMWEQVLTELRRRP